MTIKAKKADMLNVITLRKNQTEFPNIKIVNGDDSSKFIRQFYSDDIEIYESSFILLLNRNNRTIGYAKISQGGVSGTVVDVKIVCKYAVDSLASGVILAHNHPSGNINPSEADRKITKNIQQALKIFEITLLDHVILTADDYYSMLQSGDLFM